FVNAILIEADNIHDKIYFLPMRMHEGFRSEALGGIVVLCDGFFGELRDITERSETAACNFPEVGSILPRDGFGYGTAAGIAEANEKHAKFCDARHGARLSFSLE